MRFKVIPGANVTLAEGQDEYETIKVRRGVTTLPGGDVVPCMVAEIEPSAAEAIMLAGGGSLFLTILGNGWPPVSLSCENPFSEHDAQNSDRS